MKPLSLLIGLSIGLAVSARANVVLSDSFNYPDGFLVGAPGSPWQNHSGTTPVTVTNGAMRVSFSGSEDVNALLSGQPYTTTGSDSLYSSFKVRFTALPTLAGSYFAHFKDASASGFGGRIWASISNAVTGQFRVGIGNGTLAHAGSGQVAMDLYLETNYLVVTRFVPATGLATIWINPTAESDPGVTATDEGTATRPNPLDVAAYAFRQGSGYGTVWVDDLRVGTAFSDVAGPNSPPSISGIGRQSGPAGVAIGPIAFTVGDAETAAESLTLTKISTNTALVPDSNIDFGGSGSNRTVTVTPVPNVQGQTTITVTVSDGTSESSTSFSVSIGLPSISSIPDQQIPINSFPAPIPFTIGDAETPASLTLQGQSSNEALVPNANISFEGSGSSRSVVIVPATDVSGLTTITISVSDGEVSAEESFVLTVHPVLGLLKADDFDRPDGPLAGDGGWLSHSGTLQETQITNNQVRLSSSQSEDVSTEPSGAPFTPSAGHVLYSSFTVNFSQLPTASGGYFAHFKDDSLGFRGRVYASTANAAAGSFRLGIANNAAAIAANSEWPANLSTGSTYTVVTRYNVGTGVSTLWVDPTSESTAGVTAPDVPSSITVWYYAFRQTAGIGTLHVDDLKVGGAFASVFTSRPRLQIVRTGNDVEISWPAAADGYGLESSATFSSWADVTEQPTVVDDRKVVTISGVTGDLFFRLKTGQAAP
jgi:hypothetical protein